MKISKLNKLAGAFFALALVSATTSAQGWGYRNQSNNTPAEASCINRITGLTEQQKADILALDEKHQAEMATLREKRRSTSDVATKNTVRDEMLAKKSNHRDAVKALLSASQQEQYDQLHAGGGLHQYRNQSAGKGSGKQSNGFRQGNNKRYQDCRYSGQGRQYNCQAGNRRGRS